MREKLSPRRLALRLTFRPGTDDQVMVDVSYGFEAGGPIKELFCYPFKVGSVRRCDVRASFMAVSVALQAGQSLADLARVLGEDDAERAPQSLLGLAVREGVKLDDELTAKWALVSAGVPRASTSATAHMPSPAVDLRNVVAVRLHADRGAEFITGDPALFDGECAPDMHSVDLGNIPDFLRRTRPGEGVQA